MESLIVILKWIAQGLIVIVGTWGLLSDPYKTDPETGNRTLTRSGWLKIVLLGVGFLIFAVTDINQRDKAREQSIRQAEQLAMQQLTIDNQERQLAYSRELLLLQHEISEITVTLEFPLPVWRLFEQELEGFEGIDEQSEPDPTRLAYISTASRIGSSLIRYGQGGDGYLEYSLNRPMGFVSERIESTRPEWRALTRAVQAMFGRRFEIRSESGQVLIDLFSPEHQMTIRPNGTSMTLTLRSPGLRLYELERDISVVVGIAETLSVEHPDFYDEDDAEEVRTETLSPRVGPASMKLTSMDPRVVWDQAFELAWKPVETQTVEVIDPPVITHVGEWHAGPYPVDAEFVGIEL